MEDYLKIHASQDAYQTWLGSSDFITPNVSAITGSLSVFYNPKAATPSYNMLDILWSDGTATQTVRPTTDGVTPIGLCVAPTGFFGANEKARFMALKYAGGSDDGSTVGNAIGSTTDLNQELQWALSSNSSDITDLTNYRQLTSTITNNGQLADYQGSVNGGCGCGPGISEPIMLYTENETWEGLEPNNEFTGYAMGDINGKQNTTTVYTLGSFFNYPAFASVLNYYTPGTQAGDWYLPALGELALITVNQSRINAVLTNISNLYSSDCMTYITERYYWSSTEFIIFDSSFACYISFADSYISNAGKNSLGHIVIPMLMR